MRKVLYLLLFIYPFFGLLIAKEDLLVNRIWGIAVILLALIIILSETLHDRGKFNVFYRGGVLISFFMLLSILINQRLGWVDFYSVIKFNLAFFIGGIIYNQEFTIKGLKLLFRINRAFLILFLVIIISRIIQFNVNVFSIASVREQLWFGRPVYFAFFYSAFALMFLFESYVVGKFKYLKYLVFIPVIFFGARSVLFGSVIVLITLILSDIFRVSRKYLFRLGFIASIFVVVYFALNFSDLYRSDNPYSYIVASQADAKQGSDFDIDSFSSGRVGVIKFYAGNFKLEKIFFGLGGLDSRISVGLHNDFLDLFFLYGIFALAAFIYFYLFKILIPLLRVDYYPELGNFIVALVMFIFIQNLTNPFVITVTSIYFFILLITILKVQGIPETE